MKTLTTILLLIFSLDCFSQETLPEETTAKKKGTLYLTWGYHRDYYTQSSIQFINHNNGNNYDFILNNANAHDQPDTKHLFSRELSVPQYVLNIGYLFNNKRDLGVEFSWDHLKYVVTDNQIIHVTGQIENVNINTDTLVTPSFVHFEHTNGNNYASINLVKRKKIFSSNDEKHVLSAIGKIGLGGLIPKTDSYIMGKHNDGPFQLSGYVVSGFVGLRYDLYKYFFFEASTKIAFANYTNAIIHDKGKAKHKFGSIQAIASFGFNLPIGK